MSEVSSRIKKFFAHFQKHNKNVYFPSLKAYVRSILKSGTDEERLLANQWFAHKRGLLDKASKAERLKVKGGDLKLIAMATKAAKRRKTGPGGKPAATPAK